MSRPSIAVATTSQARATRGRTVRGYDIALVRVRVHLLVGPVPVVEEFFPDSIRDVDLLRGLDAA